MLRSSAPKLFILTSVKNKINFSNVLNNFLRVSFSSSAQTQNGLPYDNKPVKMTLVAGKSYLWCLCGNSKRQPFCDGSHFLLKEQIRPIKFKVDETKEYSLCNCKQTNKRPFCDGSHKKKEVQEMFSKNR